MKLAFFRLLGACKKTPEFPECDLSRLYLISGKHLPVNEPEYLEELIDFRVALEQWFFGQHLAEDASHGPDIHRTRVPSRS